MRDVDDVLSACMREVLYGDREISLARCRSAVRHVSLKIGGLSATHC